jgi:hypothetical protein
VWWSVNVENASSRKNSEEKINPRKEKSYRKDALSLFLPSFNVRDRVQISKTFFQ